MRLILQGIILMMTTINPLSATDRATPEQIKKYTEESRALLDNPTKEYRTVIGLFLRPATEPKVDLLARFERKLIEVKTPEEKAIIYFLIAETHYWYAIADVRRTHNPKVLEHAGETIIPSLIEAFQESVQAAVDSKSAIDLRDDIIATFFQHLEMEMCGADLPAALKKDVVTKFIDVVEASKLEPPDMELDYKAKIYADLGIADRLSTKLLANPKDTYEDQLQAMKTASGLGKMDDAVRFATNLQEKYKKELLDNTQSYWDVFQVFRDTAPEKARLCLQDLKTKDFNAYLELYSLSFKAEPKLTDQERKAYLQSFLDAMKAKKNYIMPGNYLTIANRMSKAGDYTGALEYVDKAMKEAPYFKTPIYAACFYQKGVCLEKLGKKTEALDAYTKAKEESKKNPGGGAAMFEMGIDKAISRLQKQ